MRNPKYRIFLILTALLLCFSFISTPITALVPTAACEEASDAENETPITASGDEVKAKETPITTNDISFDIIEEMPQEGELGQESTVGNATRANDQIISGNVYDGVYAIRNIGNGQYWMDLQQNIIDETAHIQQYNYTTSPNELFERAAMFKLSYVSATGSYIIRLMMNNLLTFELVEDDDEDEITYVKTKRIPANDSEVNPADTFIITYTSYGYTIRPYGSSESGDQYICSRRTTASGMSGAPESYLVTGSLSSNERYGRWELRKYTGTARSGYGANASPSITNGLAVGDISTVTVATWSTTIGANKPSLEVSSAYTTRAASTEITSLTDFLGKFRLAGLKAGKVKIAFGIKNASGANTQSWTQTHMVIPVLTSAVFGIRNAQTKQYMDVEGPSMTVGAYIQQWSYSGASQKQWIITAIGEGYYTIKSRYSNLYLGVDSSNASLVKQYSTLNDYTKWYFHEIIDTGNNPTRYAILCKAWSALSRGIATPSDEDTLGANLTTVIYPCDPSRREEWELYPIWYEATIENAFDSGYSVYYGETATQSAEWIDIYTHSLAERYMQLIGLALNPVDSPNQINSPIDNYKSLFGGGLEYVTPYSNRTSLTSEYHDKGGPTKTYAYWSCHKIFTGFSDSDEYNRSFSSDTCICLINRYITNVSYQRERQSKALLMHEMNHQFDASDHYHDVVDGVCQNKEFCSTCGLDARDSNCIMNKSDSISINNNDVLCDDCKEEMISHLESHHMITVNNGG